MQNGPCGQLDNLLDNEVSVERTLGAFFNATLVNLHKSIRTSNALTGIDLSNGMLNLTQTAIIAARDTLKTRLATASAQSTQATCNNIYNGMRDTLNALETSIIEYPVSQKYWIRLDANVMPQEFYAAYETLFVDDFAHMAYDRLDVALTVVRQRIQSAKLQADTKVRLNARLMKAIQDGNQKALAAYPQSTWSSYDNFEFWASSMAKSVLIEANNVRFQLTLYILFSINRC